MTANVEIRSGSDADLDALVAAMGTWVERDQHGSPTTLSETCHVLVKRL